MRKLILEQLKITIAYKGYVIQSDEPYISTGRISVPHRQNLNNREEQTDSTPVDKYHFSWTTKGVRCYPKFI